MRKILLAASCLVALPVLASAQPVNGLYVAGGAGVNVRLPSTGNDNGIGTDRSSYKVKSRVGELGLLSVGWGFGNGLRVEGEANLRSNDVRRLTIDGAARGNQGYVRTYGGMINALYDFNGISPVLTPYVGAGVGYGFNSYNSVTSNVPYGPMTLGRVGQAAGNLAYQGIAGVSYSLASMVPGLSLTAEARYYATLSTNIRANYAGSPYNAKLSNDNISGLIGFRYAFGAPAPMAAAPAAAPAPAARPAAAAPARTYLVFFDWDRADLTARAREIIKEAATNAQRANVTRIEVAGHADRSGDAAYNQRLSQRRAEAVAAELVRDGVARGNISVQAFGESRPLVPTADNVREPQNRRVEIVLR